MEDVVLNQSYLPAAASGLTALWLLAVWPRLKAWWNRPRYSRRARAVIEIPPNVLVSEAAAERLRADAEAWLRGDRTALVLECGARVVVHEA